MVALAHPPVRNQHRWLPPLSTLDGIQLDVINDSLDGTSIVYGPAGGGKTAVTLYRASVLHRQGKRCKVFVFTQVLLEFIRAATTEMQLPPDIVEPFYTWAAELHRNLVGNPPRKKYDLWVDNLIEYYQQHPPTSPLFEYVLVDEAQDFPPNVATLLRMLSRHLFVAGDTAQSLFQDVAGLDELLAIWSPPDKHALRHTFFFNNHRNPLHIASFAAEFLDSSSWDKRQFLANVKRREGGRKPVWYQVDSEEKQGAALAHIIQQAHGAVRIGALFMWWKDVIITERQLRDQGIRVQIAKRGRQYDFDDADLPILTTIHSAKGLEFDWVILADCNRESWIPNPQRPKAMLQRLFFVGATRAKERLYLLSKRGHTCNFLSEMPSDLIQCAELPQQQPLPGNLDGADKLIDLPF